ncbi:MAG: hypothetical protein ACFFEJ_14850 [Candidatus Thorarchaeota archaeon]
MVSAVLDIHEFFKDVPYNKDIKFTKKQLPKLPDCFEPSIWGQPKLGMRGQYRCACMALHAYDLGEHWIIHKDKRNPHTHPVEHLVEDAPHVLGAMIGVGALAAGAIAYRLLKKNDEESE